MLKVCNSHVEKDRINIEDGKSLSLILPMRDGLNAKVIIADGSPQGLRLSSIK
jgi:hypothetical protein